MPRLKKSIRKMLVKIFLIIIICISIVFFAQFFRDIYTVVDLKRQVAAAEEQLKLLEEENATLIQQKAKLEDPNYISTYARGRYMFSKEDEKVFYLVSDD